MTGTAVHPREGTPTRGSDLGPVQNSTQKPCRVKSAEGSQVPALIPLREVMLGSIMPPGQGAEVQAWQPDKLNHPRICLEL